LLLVALGAASALLAAQAGTASVAQTCRPTPTDAGGPFGSGEPPLRTKIGTGHVLTGVVLSALDCTPIRGARVEFWQSNPNGVYTRAGSGTVITGRSGRFRFEGPVPSSEGGFPGHIHIRVDAAGYVPLLTRYVPPRGSHRGNIRLVLVPEGL
jgi:protocatechuate 3,4-dioxygenase beta subunit